MIRVLWVLWFLSVILSFGCNGQASPPSAQTGAPPSDGDSGNSCPPVVWKPTTPKIIFVSAGKLSGAFGLSAADAVCQSEAAGYGISVAKALFVDGEKRVACTSPQCSACGNSEHVDWVLKPNTTYMRSDATLIAVTNGNSLFELPLTNPIGTANLRVWTGIAGSWSEAGGETCEGVQWTSDQAHCGPSYLQGGTGDTDHSDCRAFSDSAALCSVAKSVYCVEQ